MTFHAPVPVESLRLPAIVLSDREDFTHTLSALLSPTEAKFNNMGDFLDRLSQEPARAFLPSDGVLIVDADPVTPQQVAAVSQLSVSCGDTAIIFALVSAEVSFADARSLQSAGADAVLPITVTAEELRQEVERCRNRRNPVEPGDARPPGNIVAVSKARGGVGATTTAVNLACELAHQARGWRKKDEARRVAFVDLDLQFGDAGALFDLEDNGGMAQLLEDGEAPDGRLLKSILQRHDSGVDVLVAPMAFFPLTAVTPGMVAALLDSLQKNYDHVVIDLPRAMVDWVEPVILKAAALVLVTDTSVPCVRQGRRILDFFREEAAALPVQIVVNREKKPMIRGEHLREAEKVLGAPLGHWLPLNAKVARRSADLGKPVVCDEPRSDLGKALRKLTVVIETTTAPGQAARK